MEFNKQFGVAPTSATEYILKRLNFTSGTKDSFGWDQFRGKEIGPDTFLLVAAKLECLQHFLGKIFL